MNSDKKFDYTKWLNKPYCLYCGKKLSYQGNYVRCIEPDHRFTQESFSIILRVGNAFSLSREYSLHYYCDTKILRRRINFKTPEQINDDLLVAIKELKKYMLLE